MTFRFYIDFTTCYSYEGVFRAVVGMADVVEQHLGLYASAAGLDMRLVIRYGDGMGSEGMYIDML